MIPNKEGFQAPVVENTECIHCEKCTVTCPAIYSTCRVQQIQRVYAAQAKNRELLIEATAGGFFPVLAQYILSLDGVVFGAAYDNEMRVVHRVAQTMEEVSAFNGSKYVQSDITAALKEARIYLKQKKWVLFSGTPCQIAAILNFCKEDLDHLLTVDVICYGNPSPKLFKMYLDKLEKQHGGKIRDYRFRDKHTYGWSHTTVIDFAMPDGSTQMIEDPEFSHFSYYRMFGKRDCFRKSCYRCRFNKTERISDITTGNFWKIEKISTVFDSRLGVSMVLLNTKKGECFFEKIKESMLFEERTLQDAINGNDALIKITPMVPWRDEIYEVLNKRGYDAVVRRFYPDTITGKIIRKIRNRLYTTLYK